MPQPKSSRLTFQTKATRTTPIDKIEAVESALKDVVWYLGEDEAVRVAVTQWDKLLRQVPPQQLVQAAQTLVQQLGVETADVAVVRSPRLLTAPPQTFYTTTSSLEEILGGMDDVLVAVVQKPTILLVSPPQPPHTHVGSPSHLAFNLDAPFQSCPRFGDPDSLNQSKLLARVSRFLAPAVKRTV